MNTIVTFQSQVEQMGQVVAIEQPRVVRPRLIERPAGVQHPLPEPHNMGPLNAVCGHCMARHFHCERTISGHYSTCCSNGLMAVSGPRVLTTAPYLLQRLLVEDTVEGRHYRKNVRRYNNTLAFASFHSDMNARCLPGRGPCVFTLQGQAYRTTASDTTSFAKSACRLGRLATADKSIRTGFRVIHLITFTAVKYLKVIFQPAYAINFQILYFPYIHTSYSVF